jgi:hypothetical protein
MPKADDVVFVAAARDTKIERVRSLLSAAGFRTMDWRDMPPEGLAGGLPQILGECAALVAVVDDVGLAPAVLLEVGAALGRSLPVVVLAIDSTAVANLPPALQELPLVSAAHARTPDDESAVEQRLAATLRTALKGASRITRSTERVAEAGYTRDIASAREGVDFQRRAVAVFAHLGAQIVQEHTLGPGRRADLAVWVEGLPHPMLNPVLIELKPSADVQSISAVEQLSQHLVGVGTLLGLVVVAGERPPQWDFTLGRAIAVVGLDWVEALDERRLVGFLTDGRNRLMHGVR